MTTTGPADLTLIQVSDTHLVPSGQLIHGRVDTFALLEAAAARLADWAGPVAGILLTGDLANNGAPEAYRRLRGVIEPLAQRLGAAVVYAMGNHDERTAFRAELLDGATSPGGGILTGDSLTSNSLTGDSLTGSSPEDPCDQVHDIDGLRIIVLDSTTPGRHDGWLTDAQLAWLADRLDEPAPRGTLIVVHHPPLPSRLPTLHLLRLRAAERLAKVIDGTDVRMVLTGHAHHAGAGSLAGIPVWISPALAYHVDTLPPRGRHRGLPVGGFSRVDLVDGQVVVTAIPLDGSGLAAAGLDGARPAGAGQAAEVYNRDAQEMLDYVRSATPTTTPAE
ncbi:3',5'-cyclic-AMP phosphodiesterase [Frankia sp. AiPs1]|uniref:metallophosphoesterase n=1 Tax=Frankia sp. AiPa1 TaxID=573492 RepID=UPI00202ADA82|nr:metallophosphoesterase [Frankia sp. AiPa1]MCL9758699.1 metallophosphoesterase [Frankia sp. AiPa1]